MTFREQILSDAQDLIVGDRQDDYGPPKVNFSRIAVGWSVILDTEVTPAEVAQCMAWLKLARLVNTPEHKDSYIDAAGYIALAAELAITEEVC